MQASCGAWLFWLHSRVMHTMWGAIHWLRCCAAGSVSEAFVSYDRCARLYMEAATGPCEDSTRAVSNL